jgi:hypothetical protein
MGPSTPPVENRAPYRIASRIGRSRVDRGPEGIARINRACACALQARMRARVCVCVHVRARCARVYAHVARFTTSARETVRVVVVCIDGLDD